MTTVWYLVLIFNVSGAGSPAVVIPQFNQAVCITSKQKELERPEIRAAYCKKGALPKS